MGLTISTGIVFITRSAVLGFLAMYSGKKLFTTIGVRTPVGWTEFTRYRALQSVAAYVRIRPIIPNLDANIPIKATRQIGKEGPQA